MKLVLVSLAPLAQDEENLGAEFLWGERKDFDGAKGDDLRLQLTFKYSFSSKDFFR